MTKLCFLVVLLILCLGESHAQTENGPAPAVEVANGCRVERFEVSSPSMGRSIRAWAMLPPAYEKQPALPLLIALHGRAAPYDSWVKMEPLQKELAHKPMIVAGFDAGVAAWYLDSPLKRESRFETFFFEELLPFLKKRYRLGEQKPAITGFSMGGFGALHFALRRPQLFSSISALSGAFRDLVPPSERVQEALAPLLGPYAENPAAYRAINLSSRLLQVEQPTSFPSIYLECGTEDNFIEPNRIFYGALKKQGFSVAYREAPGAHNWAFWRDASPRILDFHWSKHRNQNPNS